MRLIPQALPRFHHAMAPCIAAIITLMLPFSVAQAQEVDFDIDAQPTSETLLDIAEAGDVQVLFAPNMLEDSVSPEVRGSRSVESAVEASLQNTALEYEFKSDDFVVVKRRDSAQAQRPATARARTVALAQLQDVQAESSQPASSPPQRGQSDAEDEEVPVELAVQTVTGSRLSRASYETPTQVLVFTLEDLVNTGEPTLERALRRLPQNINGTTEFQSSQSAIFNNSRQLLGTSNVNGSSTINLRGLGESATLILLDGKRVGHSGMLGGFTDISEFPISMIERVEIQMDGASAVYGSDAIGGVVNIISRKDAPPRLSIRHQARTKGGLTENSATAGYGIRWPTGNVQFSFDIYQSTDQGSNSSNVAALRGFQRTRNAYPGNVRSVSADPATGQPREISSALTEAAIAAGVISEGEVVNRVPIPEGQDGTSLTLADFLGGVNTLRAQEGVERNRDNRSVTPESDRYGLRVSGSQQIGWLTIDSGVTYSGRKTSSNTGSAAGDNFSVRASNPYNPFDANVYVDLDLSAFRPAVSRREGTRDTWALDFDLSGMLMDRWEWSLDSRWERRETDSETLDYVYLTPLVNLANSRSTDPQETLNVFGNSFLTDGNNAALLEDSGWIVPNRRSTSENELLNTTLTIRGALFELPAGNVRIAVGGEWREDSLELDHRHDSLASTGIGPQSPVAVSRRGTPFFEKGSRTVRSGFLELFAPVFSERNAVFGLHDLNFTLGSRRDDYEGEGTADLNSDFSASTWGAGATWRPVRWVTVRANKSTGFRAPDIAYTLFSPLVSPGFTIDFRSDRGSNPFFARPDLIDGGRPDLKAEESTTMTYGITIEPPFLEGLSIGANFHDTEFENQILRLSTAFTLVVSDLTLATYPGVFTLGENNELLSIDVRSSNVSFVKSKGWDYHLDYEFALGLNLFGMKLVAATVQEYSRDLNEFDMEGPIDMVNLWIPEARYTGEFFWERGGLRLNFTAHTRKGLQWTRPLFRGLLDAEEAEALQEVDVINVKSEPAVVTNFRGTFDFNQYRGALPGFLRNLRLSFGINNIFNQYDKLKLDPQPRSYDNVSGGVRGANDARGQLYYLEANIEF